MPFLIHYTTIRTKVSIWNCFNPLELRCIDLGGIGTTVPYRRSSREATSKFWADHSAGLRFAGGQRKYWGYPQNTRGGGHADTKQYFVNIRTNLELYRVVPLSLYRRSSREVTSKFWADHPLGSDLGGWSAQNLLVTSPREDLLYQLELPYLRDLTPRFTWS